MQKEIVTVLLPVYNGARYLREAIDSVLNQTYADFSLMVINDGSMDDSRDVVLSFDDPRIILIDNEKNLGLVSTLNRGIELIETRYLARIDADDIWERTKLEKQIEYLESHPECGLCGTSIHKFGIINSRMIFPENNDGLKVGFLFYCMMSHPSVVYRTSMLKESGLRYKADYFPAEDYKMWADCLEFTQIYNIPEPLVRYRQHQEQICREKNSIQEQISDKIRTEMLLRFYPNASSEEINFHLINYLGEAIDSVRSYKEQRSWCIKIESENKLTHYSTEAALHNGLFKYLDAKYKKYLVCKFFKNYSIKTYINYFFSFEWRYLPIKQQAKILLQK